jgi:endoglycosylceramidase
MPTAPAGAPVTWMMLFAVRRETSSAATSLSTAAASVTSSLTTARTASPTTVTGLFESVVYAPLHILIEDWINSGPGQPVDGLVNTLAGSYVIGNGATGTSILC